jgi:uncharacterized protein YdeI (YjbR/CyaY-like superfamily)
MDEIMSSDVPSNSVHPKSRAEWREWLTQHHTRAEGIWVISYKKATGLPRLEYDELVEEALCFGWIDSKARTLDTERSMLWCAPRKRGTGWSKVNKERIQRLIESGLMMPVGLAKIDTAKEDGSWTTLDSVEALEIPDDLNTALASFPHASLHFSNFPRSAKRAILEWIKMAKTPETRAKRVEETARLANENIRANQWKKT